jgi:subtilisin family serine protease
MTSDRTKRGPHINSTVLGATAAAAAGLLLAVWIGTFREPSAPPLPAAFPHVVRQPPSRRYFESAREPGRGLREEIASLRKRGFTGRGIGVAVIDGPLYTGHREFAGRLRWYDEIDMEAGDPAGWHGTAVASIAVGETAGIASNADLYYAGIGSNWAHEPLRFSLVTLRRAMSGRKRLALAIRRILAVNRGLPEDRKIRSLAIAVGWGPRGLGYEETRDAIEEARREGIFVAAADSGAPHLGDLRVAGTAGPDDYVHFVEPAGSWGIAEQAGSRALAWEESVSRRQ